MLLLRDTCVSVRSQDPLGSRGEADASNLYTLRSAAYWLSVISTDGFEKWLGRDGSFRRIVPGLLAPTRN